MKHSDTQNTHQNPVFNIRRDILICFLLVASTLLAYWDVGTFDFVRYDDTDYVTMNPHVQAGITLESTAWAFTSVHASNWHPLTWLSHMLDIHIWGMNPGGHHLSNLLFHAANTLLLFLVFNRMTRCMWQSSVVAALFALHPLHVESVAWVSERKDVLSTFFWVLTMHCHVSYAKSPRFRTYVPMLLFFVLGLMAKPMLVTLPFVLILMDYWPLNRNARFPLSKLILEKLPLFAFAGLSSVVTFIVQQHGGAVNSLASYPLSVRIANALVSYASYIGKMIWPVRLAALYPHPGMPSLWQIVGAGILITGICWVVIRNRKKHPYLPVGWLWYLGTLVPVTGLVQVGLQSMADRYTYVPLIGLFVIGAWGISDFLARFPRRNFIFFILALVVFPMLMMITCVQSGHWRNSIALFGHALDVTNDNYVAHNNMGSALAAKGHLDNAIRHFAAAIQIRPWQARPFNNLGAALMLKGENEKALRFFEKALEIHPDFEDALKNLKIVRKKLEAEMLSDGIGSADRKNP